MNKCLQYYTVMRTKNKINDSKVEFDEWWEVVDEYFTKNFFLNLAQHRANERILRYKLEVYQKNFPNFIYGSPTSTEVLCQDEETNVRPNGIAQEEEVQIEESQDHRNGVAQEEVQLDIPTRLYRKGQKEKIIKGISGTRKGGGYSSTIKRISNTTPGYRTKN